MTHLMDITARPAPAFVRGDGSWLWDDRGRRHLDFVQGWAVNTLGHAPACIRDALARQSALLLTPSPAFHNQPASALAGLLCEHSDFDQVFFTNGGAEANEGAIKLARKWGQLHKGGAHEIITFRDAFHGRTLATMSASGKPGWDRHFAPQVPGFPKAVLNDLASVQALVGSTTVAILLEPVQGESGVNAATPAFLQGLRALCDQHGLLLIFDEVQTGIGRLGTLFGYQHFGVVPDIATLAKGLGGGVPIGALLARQHACVFVHGDQGGTFNGNPLMCAVGLSVLQAVLADGFLAGVRATGEHLGARLQALSARHGLGEARGIGLLRALDLGRPVAAAVVAHARERLMLGGAAADTGLLLNAPRPSVLRFMPSLTVTPAEVDLMVDGLAASLEAVAPSLSPEITAPP
ncbi:MULTISPECIES: acetylornithine transaminase [unclassified Rhizobacter]|uniref:acetylornithine transaminase n=1 Tax=unclassified Rhizobacter TaxID=2640088 RepID=UPI0006FC2294|nr:MULTISPECIES: acetylornithine transaminase [unclassified Rhizobacter]KQU64555.1 acetylornithine aminotransferase [Rhizobacter sp. Root29]KQW03373.1 acetylornithine aminotransferase [Rhizobacter sp. Root1238]KRB13705.1 acetylornithine aminotransferase [Rhizobacter sp. Root16D2]